MRKKSGRFRNRHPWDVSPARARAIQNELRDEVIERDEFGQVSLVAGIDVGFEDKGRITRAAAVVLRFPELDLVEQKIARCATTFPYVPGLLSFREAPAALEAIASLQHWPDLLLCDGQGRAHPRRFGIACHLGVLTGLPAIGVAKSRLLGSHEPVAEQRGASVPLTDRGELIGVALRTRTAVNPLYISVGHRITLDTAIRFVLDCAPRYRLPETTRQADRLASRR